MNFDFIWYLIDCTKEQLLKFFGGEILRGTRALGKQRFLCLRVQIFCIKFSQ